MGMKQGDAEVRRIDRKRAGLGAPFLRNMVEKL